MRNRGIRVEADRIVIRNRAVAVAQMFGGLVQLVVVLFLFNIRYDKGVLIGIGVVVGVPKIVLWVRRWRRRAEFGLGGITIVNVWRRYDIAWVRVSKLDLHAARVRASNPPGTRPELLVHLVDSVVPVSVTASHCESRGRRLRLAEVLRANPVFIRRPTDEISAIARELLDWENQRVAVAARSGWTPPGAPQDDAPPTRSARRKVIAFVAPALLGAVFLGSMWYLMNPLFHRTFAESPATTLDLARGVEHFLGPCDGELVPPAPFSLSTPLETVALRADGHDVWRVHAKVDMAWNFAQDVSLQAIDASPGYLRDLPAALDFPVLAGRGLTLVIGDGTSVVEMPCDTP